MNRAHRAGLSSLQGECGRGVCQLLACAPAQRQHPGPQDIAGHLHGGPGGSKGIAAGIPDTQEPTDPLHYITPLNLFSLTVAWEGCSGYSAGASSTRS